MTVQTIRATSTPTATDREIDRLRADLIAESLPAENIAPDIRATTDALLRLCARELGLPKLPTVYWLPAWVAEQTTHPGLVLAERVGGVTPPIFLAVPPSADSLDFARLVAHECRHCHQQHWSTHLQKADAERDATDWSERFLATLVMEP